VVLRGDDAKIAAGQEQLTSEINILILLQHFGG